MALNGKGMQKLKHPRRLRRADAPDFSSVEGIRA
jgi:hypothetical protein